MKCADCTYWDAPGIILLYDKRELRRCFNRKVSLVKEVSPAVFTDSKAHCRYHAPGITGDTGDAA
jgi:hypothetical protein